MDLLNLVIRITAKDEASQEIESVSEGLIGKLASAAKTAAKSLAAAFAVKKVVDFGKAAFDAYAQFEQLSGGVEKIFDQANIDQIMTDAKNAYLDLNMSANQYLSTINDVGATFAQTMGDQKGYDTARTGLKAIADYASGTGKSVDLLSEKFTAITRATSSYQSIADQFSGILPATSADFLEQAQAAGFLSDQYKKLTDVPVAEYQEAVSKMLQKGVEDMGLWGNTADESLKTITGSIAATKSAWENLLTAIGDPDGNIGEAVDNLMTALTGEDGEGGLIRNVADEIGTVIENITESMPELLGAIGDAIIEVGPELLEMVGELLASLWEGITTWFAEMDWAGLWENVKEIFGQALESLVGYVQEHGPEMLAAAQEFFGNVWQAIQEKAPEILESVGQMVQDAINWVVENAPTMLGAALEWIGSVLQAVIEKAPQIIEQIGSMVGQGIEKVLSGVGNMLSAGIELLGGLLSGLIEKAPEILSWFQSLPQNFINAMGNIGTALYSAGVDLITGFINGVKSMAQSIWNAASSVITNAINGAKSALKIGSPSKVFHQIGVWSAEGYINAWEDSEKSVASAVEDALKAGVDVASDINLGVTATGKSEMDGQKYGDTYNFYQPYKNPYEVGREIRFTKTYGLAGMRR